MKLPLNRMLAVVMAVTLAFLGTATVVYAATDSSSITVSLPINNYISISHPSDVSMPAIAGSGGTSTGNVGWTVATNNLLGYSLSVAANGAPAMSGGGYTIPDYPATTPETWSVASNEAAFGFSAEGPATSAVTWGTPSTGSGKYRGFDGTTGIAVANNILFTSGQTTTVYFMGEIGTAYAQPSGTYTTVITATATTL